MFSLGAGALTLDSGTHTINVAGAAAAGSYTLMSYGSRIWDSTNAFTLGTTPGGGFSYGLTQSDTSVILNIAALTPSLVWDIGGGGSPIVDGAGTWADGSTDFTDTSSNTGATFLNANNYDVNFGSSGLNNGGAITLGGNVRVGGKLTYAGRRHGAVRLRADRQRLHRHVAQAL